MRRILKKTKRGFSLAELCIALALMSFVSLLAVSLINLSVTGYLGTENEITVVGQDSRFAAQLSDTIRKAGTAFTIPEASFTESNLTKGWNYLGLMSGVHIPEYCSRTGKEIASAEALVYIEYAGEVAPAVIPKDANLITTADGYFLQYVLGHSFTDKLGIEHDYSLIFEPTNPGEKAAQSITFDFSAGLSDAEGAVGDGTGIDIESLLSCLNAIQVVYQGSDANPATALSFRSDFLPTYSVTSINTSQPKATIALVLDVSSSMQNNKMGDVYRIDALRTNAKSFISDLSLNDNIQICICPFSAYTYNPSSYNNYSVNLANGKIRLDMCNAFHDKDALLSTIDNMKTSQSTNVGDGLRAAYWRLDEAYDAAGSLEDMGQVFLILMTDGEMNTYTKGSEGLGAEKIYYYGKDTKTDTKSSFNSWGSSQTTEAGRARTYAAEAGTKIVDKFNPKTYLISLCNGMTAEDSAVLQGTFTESVLFDAKTLTDFKQTFDLIFKDISEIMWAFEGPRI